MAGNRPEVIINCAASADGRIALADGKQLRISSEEDMTRVHRLRNSVDAVLVGIGTILKDDPKLTVKEKYINGEITQPLRVIIDTNGKTPEGSHVLDGTAPTLVVTSDDCTRTFEGAEVFRCGHETVDLTCLLSELHERGIRRLMVEGGSRIIGSFVKGGLFDELNIYYGSLLLGGEGPAVTAGFSSLSEDDAVYLELISVERVGGGVLHRYRPARR